MTINQARQFALALLRKSRQLFGYRLQDMNTGYIYVPYIPLFMSPPTQAETEEMRRHFEREHRRIEEHLQASKNVDLMVQ